MRAGLGPDLLGGWRGSPRRPSVCHFFAFSLFALQSATLALVHANHSLATLPAMYLRIPRCVGSFHRRRQTSAAWHFCSPQSRDRAGSARRRRGEREGSMARWGRRIGILQHETDVAPPPRVALFEPTRCIVRTQRRLLPHHDRTLHRRDRAGGLVGCRVSVLFRSAQREGVFHAGQGGGR